MHTVPLGWRKLRFVIQQWMYLCLVQQHLFGEVATKCTEWVYIFALWLQWVRVWVHWLCPMVHCASLVSNKNGKKKKRALSMLSRCYCDVLKWQKKRHSACWKLLWLFKMVQFCNWHTTSHVTQEHTEHQRPSLIHLRSWEPPCHFVSG